MKHLLSGIAMGAVVAIALPVWAQTPSAPPSAAPQSTSSTAPPSGAASSTPAPAASDKATAAPRTTASNGAQPRPRRQAHRVRRYARYGHHYGYYRRGSPSDHMARQLNAQQLYGGGWGGGPYGAPKDSPN